MRKNYSITLVFFVIVVVIIVCWASLFLLHNNKQSNDEEFHATINQLSRTIENLKLEISHLQNRSSSLSPPQNNSNFTCKKESKFSPLSLWLDNHLPISNFQFSNDKQIGFSLLDNYLSSSILYCSNDFKSKINNDKNDEQPLQSKIRCWSNEGRDQFCQTENIMIDFTKVVEDKSNRRIRYEEGALLGDCFPLSSFSPHSLFEYSMKDVMNSYQPSSQSVNCSYVINTPSYFVSRYEYANLYHITTDLINAYLASLVTGISSSDWQIILWDFHTDIPLDEMWTDLFSLNHKVIKASHLREKANEVGGRICFSNAVWSLPGYLSPFKNEKSSIFRGDFIQSFSNFVKSKYDLLNIPLLSSPFITLITRKDYFHSSTSKTDKINRKFSNEKEIEEALISMKYPYQILDTSQMTFKEQISAMRHTNILIGAHGAGLTLLLYLADEAIVVEFREPQNHHFRYLCKAMGYIYLPPLQTISFNAEWIHVNIPDFKSIINQAFYLAKYFN